MKTLTENLIDNTFIPFSEERRALRKQWSIEKTKNPKLGWDDYLNEKVIEKLQKELFNLFSKYCLTNDFNKSYESIKQVKNVPNNISEYFYVNYGKHGKLGMQESFLLLYNDIRSSEHIILTNVINIERKIL